MKPDSGKSTLIFGLVLLSLVLVAALLGPWLAPYPLGHFDLTLRLQGPGPYYLLGLDEEGRDLLTLVLSGARLSLTIGILAVSLAAFLGILFGLVAGYRGGAWDKVFIFVTDVFLAFPSILLVIALAAFWREGGLWSLIGILGGVGWVSYARIVRGQVLTLKEREFILAARVAGARFPRICRHLLPHLLPPLLINATFGMAEVILAESTLSFLGLGLPPQYPSWGRLLDQGVQYLLVAPHLALFPGLAMALVIMGFNLLGDGLRDYLDVKGQGA